MILAKSLTSYFVLTIACENQGSDNPLRFQFASRKSDALRPAEHRPHFLTEIDDLGECSEPFDSANRRRKPIGPIDLKSGAGGIELPQDFRPCES